jgi:hypothetical protein
LLHTGSGLAEKVTVERDPAAGLRAAGFFVGAGLILGRGVAGDWVSAAVTMADFAQTGWPALVLAGVVVAVERSCRTTAVGGTSKVLLSGWLPALLYVVAGTVVMLAS